MAESYPNVWKTLWEKEKLLVTSNFSFSHSVFKRLISQGRQKVSLCGNWLTLNYKILDKSKLKALADDKTRTHKVPHTPTQRLVTEQVSFYAKKKTIMQVPKLWEKSLHLRRALT